MSTSALSLLAAIILIGTASIGMGISYLMTKPKKKKSTKETND